MSDIARKVLAAFQAEHKEHLEGIRAVLADAEASGRAPPAERLEEAFRRAHSLKGGARVCDLRDVEALAHRLESVFARVRQSSASLDGATRALIQRALDAIEDRVAAVGAGRPAGREDAVVGELERFLAGPAPTPPAGGDAGYREELFAAFQSECGEHLAALQTLASALEADPAGVEARMLEDAARRAGSLREAVRIIELSVLTELTDRLHRVLTRFVERGASSPTESARAINAAVAAVDRCVQDIGERRAPTDPTAVVRLLDELLGRGGAESPEGAAAGTEAPTTGSGPESETVRVGTEQLDDLSRTADQIPGEYARHEQLGRAMGQLIRRVGELEREWERTRTAGAASLHRLEASPEHSETVRFLNHVEQTTAAVSRDLRAARTAHGQAAWSLRMLGSRLRECVGQVRLVPVESVYQGFRKLVRDLARDEGKELECRMGGFDVRADRLVLQALKDPLMHILRNAVGHGIEPPGERERDGKPPAGRIDLQITATGDRLNVLVRDDGRGIDFERIARVAVERGLMTDEQAKAAGREELARLVFQPGFSTAAAVTEISGRGVGLSVASDAVARLQGEIRLREAAGGGAQVELSVPISLSTHRLLLVACGDRTFAIPLHGVERLLRVRIGEIRTIEGKPAVSVGATPVVLATLASLLGLEQTDVRPEADAVWAVLLRGAGGRAALAVDGVLNERSAIVRPLDSLVRRAAAVSGAVVLDDGSVCLVLNPAALIEGARSGSGPAVIRTAPPRVEARVPSILVVDDSFTTRTLEKSILEAHGYRVRLAVDGIDALNSLRAEPADLVVTDIQMPRLDGFALLEAMKKEPALAQIPIVVVTSMERREDQERGLALGADAYVVKKKFDHQELLETVRQML